MSRYDGPVEPGMIFTAPDNEGRLGFRRVQVVCLYPLDNDGDLILEELESRMRGRQVGDIFRCPEFNLRLVFQPEEEPPV